MTDAHCHVRGGERCFVCDPTGESVAAPDVRFVGVHPWAALEGAVDCEAVVARIRSALKDGSAAGVGEIGLDRLKVREISPAMRALFAAQLEVAAAFRRPVVLHGAKCWGEVVKACRAYAGRIPAFLFHGFSRSGGLMPEIVALNGYVSVGPALLNDHAVNYRALAKAIPIERLLVESDRTTENAATVPSVELVAAKLAALRGLSCDGLAAQLEANAASVLSAI